MTRTSVVKDIDFWIASSTILVTTILSTATLLRWFNLRFKVGPFYVTHLLGWMGVLFITFYTPVYYTLKRRNPKSVKKLIKIHVFGNLFAVSLVSIHFAQQLGRPAQFYPELGTGIILYIVMFTLVMTGFLHRFQIFNRLGIQSKILPHQNRFIHIAITLTFYVSIIVHVLHNTGYL